MFCENGGISGIFVKKHNYKLDNTMGLNGFMFWVCVKKSHLPGK